MLTGKATSKDSDQPVRSRSMNRILHVRVNYYYFLLLLLLLFINNFQETF